MSLDVLGRRRALCRSMRRWRSMLLAAAKQCVPLPPLVLLLLLLLCVCVCVFGLCVCSMLRQSLLQPSNPYVHQQMCCACAAQKHGRDVLRMSACTV